MDFDFVPSGVCCRRMSGSVGDDGRLHGLKFTGGCNGNLKAIAALLEGMEPEHAVNILSGIECGHRGTSCMAEFSKGLSAILKEADNGRKGGILQRA